MKQIHQENRIPGWWEISFRPAVTLAALSLFAFLIPSLFESLRDGGSSAQFQGRYTIYLIFAPLYALSLSLLLTFLRTISALFSHISWVERYGVLLLALAISIGEPSFQLMPTLFSGELLNGFTRAGVALLFALLPLLLLVRTTGVNSWSFLVSLVFARILMQPMMDSSGLVSLFQMILIEYLMAFPLYALLQSRLRWIHLLYEPHPPGAGLVLFATIWTLFTAGVYLNLPSILTWIDGHLDPRWGSLPLSRLTAAPLFLFSLHWLLNLLHIRIALEDGTIRQGVIRAGTLSLIAFLVLAPGLTLYWSFNGYGMNGVREAAFSGGVAGEVVQSSALFLDGDGDGNSSWPGSDPDDGNPCRRADWSRSCMEGGSLTLSGSLEQRKVSQRQSVGPDEILLITLVGARPEDVGRALSGFRRDILERGRLFQEERFLMPSDSTALSLRALLKGVDGVDLDRGVTPETLFTALSMEGYRTICVLHSRERGTEYLSLEAREPLDHGCQIYVPDLAEKMEMEDPDFTGFSRSAYHLYLRFQEKSRNIFWLHFDGAHQGVDPDALARFISNRTKGEMHILFLDSDERRQITYWHESSPRGADLMESRISGEESYSGLNRMGVLVESERSTPWTIHFVESLGFVSHRGRITYRVENQSIQYFDPLTGYSWSEVPGERN